MLNFVKCKVPSVAHHLAMNTREHIFIWVSAQGFFQQCVIQESVGRQYYLHDLQKQTPRPNLIHILKITSWNSG